MSEQSLCADDSREGVDLEVINLYSDTVYRMAYSMVKNKFDAEDIHQEVFVRYLRKHPAFESVEHEKAWFLRVTINLCKNLWKTAWKQKIVSLGERDLEEEAGERGKAREDELIEIVKQLLKRNIGKHMTALLPIKTVYRESWKKRERAGVLFSERMSAGRLCVRWRQLRLYFVCWR